MAQKHHDWSGQDRIEAHSLVKHDLLHDYIVAYLRTMTAMPQMQGFKLTLVDGFAGGGRYLDDRGGVVWGSPVRMIQAVNEAKVRREATFKNKDFRWEVRYHFVDADAQAIALLNTSLTDSGARALLGPGDKLDVHPRPFKSMCDELIRAVQARAPKLRGGQGGNALFFLDQYGTRDVPLATLKAILQRLPNAEIILYFGVDDLLDFLPHKGPTGVSGVGLNLPRLQRARQQGGVRWRATLQVEVARQLREAVGASTFTPFFIRRPGAHRDYWLVHYANHPRANDVMKGVHWQHANGGRFLHHGRPGLDMLGFEPEDENLSLFNFSASDHARTVSALMEELPSRGLLEEPIAVDALYGRLCNETPGRQDQLAEALGQLSAEGEIDVIGPKGERRRPGTRPRGKDQVFRRAQLLLALGARRAPP